MKRLFFLSLIALSLAISALAQGAPPITFTEVDGSPRKTAPTTIKVSNGTLTCVGSVCTINTSGSGSGLADPGANGVVVRTSAGVTTARTLTGTANEITVTNGTGVSANPTFSLPSALTFTGKTVTGGTFGSATLSAPTIADFTNATHAHTNAAGGGQLNASNIFSAGSVPLARGGTAASLSDPAANTLWGWDDTDNAISFWTLGTGLSYDHSTHTISASGSGSPGGSNTQLQYNNSSSFGGISGATSDGTNVTFGSGNLRATSPRFTTGLLDANGNSMFSFTATGSAVNGFGFTNAATGNSATFSTVGGDSDIPLILSPKGTSRLESTGPLRLSGSGSDSFTTPLGAAVPTKINVPLYNPGAFGQILALGLESGASSTARVIMLIDQRVAGHQATLALLSPDETQIFGFTWDGSNSIAKIINTATGGTIVMQSAGVTLSGATLTNLGTPADGTMNYCSDCNRSTDPCTSGGSGALAVRANGRWYCP